MNVGAGLSSGAGLIAVVVVAVALGGNVQAAVVEWVGGAFGGGEWHVPGNWSSVPLLPDPTDNVVIGVDPTTWPRVTHSLGDDTVKTLSNEGSLTVANSQLTVTGNVTLGPRSELVVDGPGAIFRGQGSVFLLGPELGAMAGGEISLPGAKHFADDNYSSRIWATGAGSKIDLPALEDISGSPALFNVRDGATINVPSLIHIEERSGFYADGVGSKIDLSSVRAFPPSQVEVSNGGEIVFPLEPLKYAEIRISGAQSKVNLAHLTAIETLNLGVSAGARIDFPLVQRLVGGSFQTGGGNSLLDLSTVTALDPPPPNSWGWPSLTAREQSRIDLTGIQQVNGASPRLEANGPGAVIDLSNLESYVGSGLLRVSGGGKLLLPKLTRLDGPYVEIEGAGSQMPLDGLSSIDFFPISAKAGAVVHLPQITGLNTAPGGRGNSLSADGGVIDVSNATALRGAGNGYSLFEAIGGGRVDLSGVGEVVVGNAVFRSTGAGSVVDLRRATKLHNTANAMSVSVSGGGRVRLDSLISASGVEWVADGAGSTIDLPSLETLEKSSARVNNGAKLELPSVTSLANVGQLWAVGAESRLSLAQLRTYEGQENEPISFQATYGGTLGLPSLETLLTAGELRTEFDGSVIDLPALQTLAGKELNPLKISLERGGQLRAPSMKSLAHAQIQVVQANSWFETDSFSDVENVSIAVQHGAQGQLGTAPTLTARTFVLTASQANTNLNLPTLEALVGMEGHNATILASEGATVEIPMLRSLQYSGVAARDPASRLVVGSLATMDSGLVVAEGGDVRVDAVRIESRNSALAAQGGRLELPLLESFRDPTGNSTLTAEGGVIDFGQQSVAFSGVTIRKYASAELHAERLELEPGSRLEGAGPLDADVANAGGIYTYPENVLTIAGDYEQGGSGVLQVSLARTVTAGEIVVEGLARLDGRLELLLAFDKPLLGSEHAILRANRIEGAFASGGTMAGDSMMFAPLIREQTIVVVAALGGDANLDGRVDLNDFGSLKVGFGAGHGVADGDFDGDGAVTLSDFGILKRNFGRQGPGFLTPPVAVPEPNTALLIALGAFAFRRRWKGRRC